jgi:hypothetical protein
MDFSRQLGGAIGGVFDQDRGRVRILGHERIDRVTRVEKGRFRFVAIQEVDLGADAAGPNPTT